MSEIEKPMHFVDVNNWMMEFVRRNNPEAIRIIIRHESGLFSDQCWGAKSLVEPELEDDDE